MREEPCDWQARQKRRGFRSLLLQAGAAPALKRKRRGQAAIGGADVVAGAECAERRARAPGVIRSTISSRIIRTKRGVRPDGRGPDHVHAELAAQALSFHVQIVNHFQVIRDKPDRHDDHVAHSRGMLLPEPIADVGLEPRLRRRAATALKNQVPASRPAPRATSRLASRSCTSYCEPAAIACGILWAVNAIPAAGAGREKFA